MINAIFEYIWIVIKAIFGLLYVGLLKIQLAFYKTNIFIVKNYDKINLFLIAIGVIMLFSLIYLISVYEKNADYKNIQELTELMQKFRNIFMLTIILLGIVKGNYSVVFYILILELFVSRLDYARMLKNLESHKKFSKMSQELLLEENRFLRRQLKGGKE